MGSTAQTRYSDFVLVPGYSGLIAHNDWLGSTRFISNRSTRALWADYSYAPFRESSYTNGFSSGLNFTGQTQDTTTGIYDFQYREYSPAQGRWVSPDPAGLQAVDPANPQSLNRYSYVLNNPLNSIIPTGLQCVWDNGSYDSADDPDTGAKADCQRLGGTYFDPSTFSSPNGDWSDQPNAELESEVASQTDYTFKTQVNAPMPSDSEIWWGSFDSNLFSNWSWGVRGPNQTYRQCLAGNSGNYSFAGAINQDSGAAKLALGNDVASSLFGDAAEGQAGLIFAEGGSHSLTAGAGEVMTYGRRTFLNTNSVPSLNLAGTPGRAAQVLGKTGAEKVAGVVSGLAEVKFAADVGATGALMLGCLTHP